MREAMFYEQLSDRRVRCHLCAHGCEIAEGRTGICQVRENLVGCLYSLVYGRTIARHVDPVEKKPLLHFYPGTRAYSVATPGCNFRCRWCQNADISQVADEGDLAVGMKGSPAEIVSSARRNRCRSIAYTYTEPTIFFEYTYDIAKIAHQERLANIYVTNGFMTEKMLDAIHPYLDAANVDLKAFRDETYREQVGGRLEPVLASLRKMKELGIWVEVTTLLIPHLNDGDEEIRDIAGFIAEELGPETPWHLSRFRPTYRMQDRPPTALQTLLDAQRTGRAAGLRYVYVGNVPGEANTICHACGHTVVRRAGYRVFENRTESGGVCPDCGARVAGVGMGVAPDVD